MLCFSSPEDSKCFCACRRSLCQRATFRSRNLSGFVPRLSKVHLASVRLLAQASGLLTMPYKFQYMLDMGGGACQTLLQSLILHSALARNVMICEHSAPRCLQQYERGSYHISLLSTESAHDLSEMLQRTVGLCQDSCYCEQLLVSPTHCALDLSASWVFCHLCSGCSS